MVTEHNELLTAQEAADRLRITTRTLRRWIKDGKITAIRIGRTLRVRIKDVDKLVDSCQT
jgi:excisionase family DNA binding protein